MTLIPCHECGREISTTARDCPGCGAPVGLTRDQELGRKALGAGGRAARFVGASVIETVIAFAILAALIGGIVLYALWTEPESMPAGIAGSMDTDSLEVQ